MMISQAMTLRLQWIMMDGYRSELSQTRVALYLVLIRAVLPVYVLRLSTELMAPVDPIAWNYVATN